MGKGKDRKITKDQIREFWKHGIHPITGLKKDRIKNDSVICEKQTPIAIKKRLDYER